METNNVTKKVSENIEQPSGFKKPILNPSLKPQGTSAGLTHQTNSPKNYVKKTYKPFKKEKPVDWKTLDLEEKKNIQDLNPVEAEFVYNKLFKLWEMEKARKFLKHLISAFFPYNPENQLMNAGSVDIIDALTNKKCTGVFEVSDAYSKIGMKRMSMIGHAMVEKKDEIEISKVKELQEMQRNLPDELRYCRIAMLSDKSDKFLSRESTYALHQFVVYMMDEEERYNMSNIVDGGAHDNCDSYTGEITGCVNMIIKEKNRQRVGVVSTGSGVGQKYVKNKMEPKKTVKHEVPGFKGGTFQLEGSNMDKLEALKEMMSEKE